MSQEGNNNNDMTKDVNDIKKLNLKKENNIQNINRNNMNEDKKSDVDLESLLEKLKEQNLNLKRQSVRGISSVSNDIKLNFDYTNYNNDANNIENNNKQRNIENVNKNNELSSNLNSTINRQNVANSIFTNRTTEKEKSLENHLLNFGGTNINNTNINQNINNDKASNGSKMKIINDLFESSINSDMRKNIVDDLFSSNYDKDNGSVMKNQFGNDLMSGTNRYVKPENVIYENNEIDEKGKKEFEEKEFEFEEKHEEIEKSRANNREEQSIKLIDLSNKEDINYSFVPVEKSFQPIMLDDIPLTIQNEGKKNNIQDNKKEDEKFSVHSATKENKNEEGGKLIRNSEVEKESLRLNELKKEEKPPVQKEHPKKNTIKLEDNNIILNSKDILSNKEKIKNELNLKEENQFDFDFGNDDEDDNNNKNSMSHLPKKESMKTENEFEKNVPIKNEDQKSGSISIEINQEVSEKAEGRKKDITQETISKNNNSINTEEIISVAPSFSKDKYKKDKPLSPRNKSPFSFPKFIKKKAQANNSKEESSKDNSLKNKENQKLLNLSKLNRKNESPPNEKKTNKQNTFPKNNQHQKQTNVISNTIDPQMPLPEIFAEDNSNMITNKQNINNKGQNLTIYDLTNFSYQEPSYKEYLCSSILISKDNMQFSSIEKRKIILSSPYFSSMLAATNDLKQISSLPNMSIYFNSVIINYIEINEHFDKIFNYVNSSLKNEAYSKITKHPSYLSFSPLPISKFSSLLNNNIKFPQTKQKIEYIRPIRAQNGDSFYVALLVGLMESFINTKSKVKIYSMFLDTLRVSEIETNFFSGVNFPEAIIVFNIIYDFIECSNFKEANQIFISALDVNKDFNHLMVSYIKYIVLMCLSDIEINKKMKNKKHPSTFYQRLVLHYNEPNNLIFELIPYIFDVVLNIFYYESASSNEVNLKTYQNDIQSEDGTKKYTINLFFYNTGYHVLYDKEIINKQKAESKSSSLSKYILYSNENNLTCPKCKNSLFLQDIASNTLICSECLITKISKVMQTRSSLLINDGFLSRECKLIYQLYNYYRLPSSNRIIKQYFN